MNNLKNSEADVLEQCRVSLDNVEKQPKIAKLMAEMGYDTAAIAAGRELYFSTRKIYDFNKREDDETSVAYAAFKAVRDQLYDIYKLHRKRAKVVFLKDPEIIKQLELDYAIPRTYIKRIEAIKKFYVELLDNEPLQQKLLRLKVTTEELARAYKLITPLEQARNEYLIEKGESQDATQAKDKALGQLEDWMSEFYAVSKIALEDNLQLLEALGILVRN